MREVDCVQVDCAGWIALDGLRWMDCAGWMMPFTAVERQSRPRQVARSGATPPATIVPAETFTSLAQVVQ
jgi:hypothetical protein